MLLCKVCVICVFAVSTILCSSGISPKYSYGGKITNDIPKNAWLYFEIFIHWKNIFIHVPFSDSLFLVDNYLYVDPKSNSIRYYKETDSNYYARIRKENSKHVHQEPNSFEMIITGVYFVSFYSLYEKYVWNVVS